MIAPSLLSVKRGATETKILPRNFLLAEIADRWIFLYRTPPLSGLALYSISPVASSGMHAPIVILEPEKTVRHGSFVHQHTGEIFVYGSHLKKIWTPRERVVEPESAQSLLQKSA